jgi:hypothetical protein
MRMLSTSTWRITASGSAWTQNGHWARRNGEDGRTEKFTSRVDKAINWLEELLRQEKLNQQIETMPAPILNEYLHNFCSALRQGNGGFYSPVTLSCIRSGIHTYTYIFIYFTGPGVCRPINILKDREFVSSNRMLEVVGTSFLRKVRQNRFRL